MRVLVVDASPVFRLGVRAALAGAGMEVVAEADHATAALRQAERAAVDLAIVSDRLRGASGVALAAVLRGVFPRIGLVVLAEAWDDARLLQAAADGVDAALPAAVPPEDLRAAAVAIAAGGQPIADLLASRQGRGDCALPRSQVLRRRWLEVLDGMARGLPNRAIADELCLTEGTVRGYARELFRCVGVAGRTEAVVWAAASGTAALVPTSRSPRRSR